MRPAPAIVGALLAPAVASLPAVAGTPAYAFDQPRLLAQQLIWGRLHGVRLLALACRDRGAAAAAMAYADWLDRQGRRIRSAERDLARHYFDGHRADPESLARALGLRPALERDDPDLAAACASLPAALAEPRNDLHRIYDERRQAALRGGPEAAGAVWQEDDE